MKMDFGTSKKIFDEWGNNDTFQSPECRMQHLSPMKSRGTRFMGDIEKGRNSNRLIFSFRNVWLAREQCKRRESDHCARERVAGQHVFTASDSLCALLSSLYSRCFSLMLFITHCLRTALKFNRIILQFFIKIFPPNLTTRRALKFFLGFSSHLLCPFLGKHDPIYHQYLIDWIDFFIILRLIILWDYSSRSHEFYLLWSYNVRLCS